MYTRFVFVATIALVVCASCKASEQSAARDDAEAHASQSESPVEDGQAQDRREQGAKEQQEGGAASDSEEMSQAPTREKLGELSKAAKKALMESELHDTWVEAKDAGNAALLGWYPFGFEGSDELAGSASALRAYFETVSVNELPVDVAGLNTLAWRKGVNLSQFTGSEVERLSKVGEALDVPYVASGTLVRDGSSGSVLYKLRILVVEKGASEAVFDEIVLAQP